MGLLKKDLFASDKETWFFKESNLLEFYSYTLFHLPFNKIVFLQNESKIWPILTEEIKKRMSS